MRRPHAVLALGICLALMLLAPVSPVALASGGRIEALRDGTVVERLTDGDSLQLRLSLPEAVDGVLAVEFALQGGTSVATCTIEPGQAQCETDPILTLGWHWNSGVLQPGRTAIDARRADTLELLASTTLDVNPRPVVMVHGFASSWEAWVNYLGPTGYLAAHGIPGFAVGDGQVPGKLNTGNLAQPDARTNTLLENATVLGEYIDAVQRLTGAQMVDLVAHSMGGLISRTYIGRVMAERDVAQLIMLGSPMAGTDCANLPAALGLYLPATLELRPSYVRSIFNPQVTQRHGVAFHALAGVPILEGFKSPCTDVPTDLAVSLSSVTAIPLDVVRLPILHMDLNLSAQAFDEFVLPLLQAPAASFSDPVSPPPIPPQESPAQFSRLFHGHIDAGSSAELIIPIDPGITVASFALYDTTRTLQVTVTGASGKTIELDAEKNGLVIVDDPEALFTLGYGFKDPKPGPWRVRLSSTDATPAGGADFALTARYTGGAELVTQLDPLLPRTGDAIEMTAALRLAERDLALASAEASIQRPDGTIENVSLHVEGPQADGQVQADLVGIYGVDVVVTGRAPDGTPIERSAHLAFEVQPDVRTGLHPLAWVGALLVVVTAAVRLLVWRRRRRRSPVT